MRDLGSESVVHVTQAQSRAIADATRHVGFDDAALRQVARQREFVDGVRGRAGPAVDDLVLEMRRRLAAKPWFTVARGLPAEQASGVLVALSARFGEIVEPYNQPWSRMVRHIIPATDKHGGSRTLNEFLHTDGTDWVRPNDYTCLLCVHPDNGGGGRSLLLDIDAIVSEAEDLGVLGDLTTQPVPWRVADELGGGVHWEPVVRDGNDPVIRWLRYTVAKSWEDGLAHPDPGLHYLLDRFERLIEGSRAAFGFMLRAGDVLVVDNARCLHARSAIMDPARSARELRRTKVIRRDQDRRAETLPARWQAGQPTGESPQICKAGEPA
jgi:Taurine catabolism dioxygenase TauD, TfdA family